ETTVNARAAPTTANRRPASNAVTAATASGGFAVNAQTTIAGHSNARPVRRPFMSRRRSAMNAAVDSIAVWPSAQHVSATGLTNAAATASDDWRRAAHST